MNTDQRLRQYTLRGFSRETAVVNVLIEQTLETLFSAFPNTFIFFGGASLVLFYGSQRHSGDLDLLVSGDQPPSVDELLAVLERPLVEFAQELEVTDVKLEATRKSEPFAKILVSSGREQLFTIDLTKISAAIASEVSNATLNISDNPVTIAVPSRNLELLFKAEAFLTRRTIKVRDAFDIKLLMDSGAVLNEHLKAHLMDGPASERIEMPEFISDRIEQITRNRCQAELRPFLPRDVYVEFDRVEFEPLKTAVTRLFADWL